MRITIELDPADGSVGNTATQTSAVITGAENAGAAPESTSVPPGRAGDSSDAGGPPQWLLDAVNKAMAAAGDTATADVTQGEDAGAGPASY